MGREKGHINIVFIGHVDSCKSTTAGHLIYKLGGMDKRALEIFDEEHDKMIKRLSSTFYDYKPSPNYARILDKLKVERGRVLSIKIAQGKLETTNYHCTIIKTPGHRDYIKNMITGTSQPDCAVLIIDSCYFDRGISKVGHMREYILLAFTLGVNQMICCCNKMEMFGKLSETIYQNIMKETFSYLGKVGYNLEKIPFIPISASKGYNLTERSTIFDWYHGLTLLEAIDNVNEPKRPCDEPLRLLLQDVYKIGGIGTVSVGGLEIGVIKPGMVVTSGPTGLTREVKSVKMHHESLLEAHPGDLVGFNIENVVVKDLKRGYLTSNLEDPATGCT